MAFRVVEEALRAACHGAGATDATVRIAYDDRGLELEVRDDGGERTLGDGGGSDPQLVSIRERVGLFGGELHTGPERDGGFAVRARLPLAGLVARMSAWRRLSPLTQDSLVAARDLRRLRGRDRQPP